MSRERRKFERLNMPQVAKVVVNASDGKKIGVLKMLGRGGFQVETKKKFNLGESYEFVIVDKSEDIKRSVRATVRNIAPGGLIGLEFDDLDPDAAVEMGVIIGKYYSAAFQ